MNWLTGFDAWSMYVPQIMLVTHDREPIWMGRNMDAGAVALTTYLKPESVMPYPETHVQQAGIHAMDLVAGYLCELGLNSKRIGYESDTYFFSPKAFSCLQQGVADADWIDADLLVNWCRVVKSDAEIAVMRQAAKLVEGAMTVAYENIAPGVRQCDLMAKILAKQVGGNEEFGGDLLAWDAEITKDDLSFNFKAPEVLFDVGDITIKPRFQEVLNSFFPRYLGVIDEFKKSIDYTNKGI